MATFHLALGFNQFSLFCQWAKTDTDQENFHPDILAETAALIEDEPEDEEVDPEFQVNAPKATSCDLDGPNTHEDEEDHQVDNVTAEFLKYHQKLNHCSPRHMQLHACSWVISRWLA